MRIFLDTNVLASALATRGLCSDVLREVLTSHELIISDPLLSELQSVLIRKFRMPLGLALETISFLKQDTIASEAGEIPKANIRDKDDLIILSCALNGNADVFVTGDKELLELKKIKELNIISPRSFWDRLRKG